LNVIHLRVPALRERPFDIPLLVEYFITKASNAAEMEPLDVLPEMRAILTAYSGPENVRELENAIERTVALAHGARLTPDDLPE
jgi:DNA-binding NtrC family response regulator